MLRHALNRAGRDKVVTNWPDSGLIHNLAHQVLLNRSVNKSEHVHVMEAPGGNAPARASGFGVKSERRVLRVWVVDANPALRELFAHLLNRQQGFRCTRQFASAESLLAALAEERAPHLLVLEVDAAGSAGFAAIRAIRKAAPPARVLISALFSNSHYEAEAYRAGAAGFLLKSYEIEETVALLQLAYVNPQAEPLFPNLAQLNRLEHRRPTAAKPAPCQPRLGLLPTLRLLCRGTRRRCA